MAENYLSLDDLRSIMGERWKDTDATRAARLIAVAAAGLRQIFKDHGLNLDDRITSGDTERILVEQAIAEMVEKSLTATVTPMGGDFSQFSQSAGGYSISVSSNGGNLYLKKETARWLGLPSVTLSAINLFGSKPSKNFLYTFDLLLEG